MKSIYAGILVAALVAQPVLAAATPEQKCQASKNKAAGKYVACRHSAEAKLATTGDTVKYDATIAKCESKFTAAWQKAIDKATAASVTCPDSPLTVGNFQTVIDEHADNIATALNGGGLVSCATLPAEAFKTGQTLCYNSSGTVIPCAGTGQDGESLKGVSRSYTDNGNGTITDNKTGLIWEKLDNNNANGIHDYDVRTFTWDNAFKRVQVLNGNVAGCVALNNPDACCTGAGTGSCSPFAGQTDWRLPNQFELISLTDLGRVSPAIDPLFSAPCTAGCTAASCSCTVSLNYWSATTSQISPAAAWSVGLGDGTPFWFGKSTNFYVRAVRSGS